MRRKYGDLTVFKQEIWGKKEHHLWKRLVFVQNWPDKRNSPPSPNKKMVKTTYVAVQNRSIGDHANANINGNANSNSNANANAKAKANATDQLQVQVHRFVILVPVGILWNVDKPAIDNAPRPSISHVIWTLSSDNICQLNQQFSNSEAAMLSSLPCLASFGPKSAIFGGPQTETLEFKVQGLGPKVKHHKNCESCPTKVIWKIKF